MCLAFINSQTRVESTWFAPWSEVKPGLLIAPELPILFFLSHNKISLLWSWKLRDSDSSREAMADTKIVVVGAGPVGSLAALYAAKRGYQVEVYELRPGK